MRRVVYRLVGDGKLRSREGANGEIQIWVRDDDRVIDDPVSSFDVAEPTEVTTLSERGVPATGVDLSAVLAPLSASYERNVQLAHENGSLKERATAMERELHALRDSSVFDKRALQHVTERLRALEARQAQAAETTPEDREKSSWGSVWWWWLWLVPGFLLCVAVAVVWFVGWPL